MLTEAQERPRAQLAARFAQSDSRVGAPRSTLSFLQNQIGAWNARDKTHARPAPPGSLSPRQFRCPRRRCRQPPAGRAVL